MKERSGIEVKDIDNRLATIEGHIRAIRQMYADDKDCEEILLQLYATTGALKKLSKKILVEHMNTCVKEDIKAGEEEKLDQFIEILDKYI